VGSFSRLTHQADLIAVGEKAGRNPKIVYVTFGRPDRGLVTALPSPNLLADAK